MPRIETVNVHACLFALSDVRIKFLCLLLTHLTHLLCQVKSLYWCFQLCYVCDLIIGWLNIYIYILCMYISLLVVGYHFCQENSALSPAASPGWGSEALTAWRPRGVRNPPTLWGIRPQNQALWNMFHKNNLGGLKKLRTFLLAPSKLGEAHPHQMEHVACKCGSEKSQYIRLPKTMNNDERCTY